MVVHKAGWCRETLLSSQFGMYMKLRKSQYTVHLIFTHQSLNRLLVQFHFLCDVWWHLLITVDRTNIILMWFAGFFSYNYCGKSRFLCLGAQKLESSGRICTHSHVSNQFVCIYRASTTEGHPSSCKIVDCCFLS